MDNAANWRTGRRPGAHAKAALALLLCVLQACAGNSGPSGPVRPRVSRPPTPQTLLVPDRDKPLRVGITPGLPPFVYRENEQIAGLEAAFAEAISAAFQRPLEYVELLGEDHAKALEENRIDIVMSAVEMTGEHEKVISFCDPYLKAGHLALIRRADRPMFRTANDVKFTKQRVATEEGSGADALVRREMRFCKHFYVDGSEQAAEALLRQDIDVYIGIAPAVSWIGEIYNAKELDVLPFQFSSHSIAWAVRRDDQAMMTACNAVLARLGDEGKLDALLDRWLPKQR